MALVVQTHVFWCGVGPGRALDGEVEGVRQELARVRALLQERDARILQLEAAIEERTRSLEQEGKLLGDCEVGLFGGGLPGLVQSVY